MPYLFRSINKRRWDWSDGNPTWLAAGAIPAAPFGDVSPSPDSELSLWWIPDDKSTVHRIVTALAAGRQHPDKFDYALIDETTLRELGFMLRQVPESCPDQDASNQWHHNLTQLSANDLRNLVNLIKSTAQLERVQGPQVKTLLTTALDAGVLDEAKVNPKLRESLQRRARQASRPIGTSVASVRTAPPERQITAAPQRLLMAALRYLAGVLRRSIRR